MASWKLTAIQEQFEVFRSLKNSHMQIETGDDGVGSKIFNAVEMAMKKHLYVDDKVVCKPTKDVGMEVIKQIPQNVNKIELSFVVLIINQYLNGKLCKVPVFVIRSGHEWIFIDTNCLVYQNWDTFLKDSDLRHVDYVYPVEGYYNLQGNLKVDLKKSCTTVVQTIYRSVSKGMGTIIGVGITVATCFFEHPAIEKITDCLLPLAEKFVPGVEVCVQKLRPVQQLFTKLQSGLITWTEFLLSSARHIQEFHSALQDEISHVWSRLVKLFWSTYGCVLRFFRNLYFRATDIVQRLFLATTRRISGLVNIVQSKFVSKLKKIESVKNKAEVVKINEALTNSRETEGARDNIFDECKNECALNIGVREKQPDLEPMNPVTKDIFTLSDKIVQGLQSPTLNDAQVVLESISQLLIQDYESRLHEYTVFVQAAKTLVPDLDMKAYNENLGIKESVEMHYWNQTMVKFASSPACVTLKEKIKEVSSNKKILLIQMSESNELYKCMGVPQGGTISARDLIQALKEIPVQLNEHELLHYETNTLVCVKSGGILIQLTQELDNDNTSNGTVYISKMKTEN